MSLVSESTYRRLWVGDSSLQLKPSEVQLSTYSVSQQARSNILNELAHPGVVQMEALAQSCVWWRWEDAQKIKLTCSSPQAPTAPMGVVKAAMVSNSCWLCWSVSKMNVYCHHWLLFQVAGSSSNQRCDCHECYWEDEEHLCSLRFASNDTYW